MCFIASINKDRNMKILFIIILITNYSFSQNIEITKEKIDVNYYKKLPLYPDVLDNKNGNSHFYLYEKNLIQFYQDSLNISIQVRRDDSPYKTIKLYSNKTKLLLRESLNFYDFCIGYTKIYNETGELIEKNNCDVNYLFSVEKIIEKVKKDYQIDLEIYNLGVGLSRIRYENKNCYSLTKILGTAKSPTRIIIFDGNSGDVLSDKIHKYNEKNDPRI